MLISWATTRECKYLGLVLPETAGHEFRLAVDGKHNLLNSDLFMR